LQETSMCEKIAEPLRISGYYSSIIADNIFLWSNDWPIFNNINIFQKFRFIYGYTYNITNSEFIAKTMKVFFQASFSSCNT